MTTTHNRTHRQPNRPNEARRRNQAARRFEARRAYLHTWSAR